MTGGRTSSRLLKEEISRRIAERVWEPGALIPGEETLAREFGAARATVNRALQELARAGLVERKRKAGTRVALHPVREARFAIPVVGREIEARGQTYRYQFISRRERRPPSMVAERLGVPSGTPFVHVTCLHLADDAPYQFEDRWIDAQTVPTVLSEGFETVGPNEWLVGHAPLSEAEFTFYAAAADASEADALSLAKGAPVFVAERRTWLRGKPVTLVRMVHPPAHRLVTRL